MIDTGPFLPVEHFQSSVMDRRGLQNDRKGKCLKDEIGERIN